MKLANNKFKNYLPVVATVPTKLASRNQRKEPKPSKPGCKKIFFVCFTGKVLINFVQKSYKKVSLAKQIYFLSVLSSFFIFANEEETWFCVCVGGGGDEPEPGWWWWRS